MKKALLCLILATLAASASTQPGVAFPSHNVPNMSDERSRIQTERLKAEGEFDQQSAACYAKFAVTDCIAQARTKQRAVLDRLRGQEIALNNRVREQKVQAKLTRLQANASDRRDVDTAIKSEPQ